jgi:Lrp/AsnC family transcriptional regulator for asnA, asnC and gidA
MYKLNDLDYKIIAQLEQDPRSSNKLMADAFSVSEGTIRQRLKKLIDNKIIAIRALTNVFSGQRATVYSYRVEAHPKHARTVAQTFADRDESCLVILAIGRFNILIMSMCENPGAAQRIRDDISMTEGVANVEMTSAIKPVKFDFNWTKIK